MSSSPKLTQLDPARLQFPEKPALEGLEAKWMSRWEESGVYRFPRGGNRADVRQHQQLARRQLPLQQARVPVGGHPRRPRASPGPAAGARPGRDEMTELA